jgi:aryl-alcohol dehydrogenase-like predicted oxidoreductase
MHTPESTAHATGVKVSRVVFGGNVLGWTADQATGFAMLDRLVDAGLTTIDTADVYSGWVPGHQGGESESVLGAWLRARGPAQRERVQIMTKVGKRAAANPPPGEGLSPGYIAQAIDASLARLGTDYVDVYFSHAFDPAVPQADTLGAYQRLIDAGKVRAIGASNFTAAQVREALDVAAAQGLPPDAARALVAHTFAAAGQLIAEKPAPMADLLLALITPGGITERGLDVLRAQGVPEAWDAACDAVLARLRG